METALYAICAAAGWVAFAYKLPDLRRDRDNRVLRAMVYAFCAYAAGVSFAIPPLATAVDDLTGLPNLAKLLAHAGVMSIAAQAEVLLLFLALPPELAAPRARRRLWASATAFGVLAALWLSTLWAAPPVRLTVEYARVPAVTAYLAVYLCVFVVYSADITRLCWRFARVSPRPWLRRGLRITAVGSAFALAYCTTKAGYLVAYRLGHGAAGEAQIAAVLVTIAALSMLVGLTLPAWGPAAGAALAWLGKLCAWYRLRPLWQDITRAQPHLVLDDQAHRLTVALRDIDYALHRRITEIRDGRLALRSFIDRRVGLAAAPLLPRPAAGDGEARAAVAEAVLIAAGIRGVRANAPAEQADFTNPHNPPDGYRGEIAWLARVARAYRRSAIVRRALAQSIDTVPDEPVVPAGGSS